MAYDYHKHYKTCLDCGSNLDHGETCDCQHQSFAVPQESFDPTESRMRQAVSTVYGYKKKHIF